MSTHQRLAALASCVLLPVLGHCQFTDKSSPRVERFGQTPAPRGEGLKVEVQVQQPEVEIGTECELRLSLVNTIDRETKFRVTTGSWCDLWCTDSVFLPLEGPWDTTKVDRRECTLAPGQRVSFAGGLKMLLTDSLVPGTVYFRVGFTPIGTDYPIWSDRLHLVAKAPRGRGNPAVLYGVWRSVAVTAPGQTNEGALALKFSLDFRAPNHFSWSENVHDLGISVTSGFYYTKGHRLFLAELCGGKRYMLINFGFDLHGDELVLSDMVPDRGVVLRRTDPAKAKE